MKLRDTVDERPATRQERCYQRGDGDMVVIIIAILLCVFLFVGEPDAWDKLHAYVMSLQPIEAKK